MTAAEARGRAAGWHEALDAVEKWTGRNGDEIRALRSRYAAPVPEVPPQADIQPAPGEEDRLKRAVDNLASAMKHKLIAKMREGYHGWDDPAYHDEIAKKLWEHTYRLIGGDTAQAVDVANLAMMLGAMPRGTAHTPPVYHEGWEDAEKYPSTLRAAPVPGVPPEPEPKHKPCPFCGGNPHVRVGGMPYIVCNDCTSEGRVEATEAEAWQAWDRRTP